MPDQYRRDDERDGRRSGWSDTSRGNDRPDDRGDQRLRRGGDWRGGQSGRWNRSEQDDRSYAMSDRGGIARETGFDRGTSRDEHNSRDWQQRVGEGAQGYRAQDQQSEREWQGEPDWESDRSRGWQGGRDRSQGSSRGQDQWHGSQEQWRGSQEPERRAAEDRGIERGGYGARSWPDEGGGWRGQQDREQGWRGGRHREHEQERFGTGGNREYEQDWRDPGRSSDQGRGDQNREGGGHPRGRSGAWNEGFGGETWQARGEEPDRASGSFGGRREERQQEERGREGGRGPGGGWPWGGGGGPMSTWGIGGSESPRGIGGTREGAWPGYSGRGPKGYKRSDERIREQVSDCLMDDHDVDASDITVEVKDGDVTLTGTVQNREQKRRAEELVERLNGVSEVINNLRVNRETGQAWQTTGQPGSQQVGQQVPIGGQQSAQGIRAGRDPQSGQAHQPGSGGGQAATQAGQQGPQPGQQQPGQQGTQPGGGKSTRNP